MRSRQRELGLLFLTCAAGVTACGSPDHVTTAPAKPSGVVFDVESKSNHCPAFAYYAITPSSIPPLTPADVRVSVSDPDGMDLTLLWSATSGFFLAEDTANTLYACNHTGPQTLTLSATDALDCERRIDLDVLCLAH